MMTHRKAKTPFQKIKAAPTGADAARHTTVVSMTKFITLGLLPHLIRFRT